MRCRSAGCRVFVYIFRLLEFVSGFHIASKSPLELVLIATFDKRVLLISHRGKYTGALRNERSPPPQKKC
jgi:hypothetical protein